MTKTAIVTGGGSGIGKASALALARNGWNVAIAGRRREQLEETVKAHGERETRILPIVADVSDPAAVKRLFEETTSTFGKRLDLLFNNAGRGAPGVMLEDLTSEQWLDVVGVNLNGTFYCTQEAIRLMKDQDPRGGRIINNGSI